MLKNSPTLPVARAAVLDQILRSQTRVWRGYGTAAVPSVATGLVALDRLLPGCGWPVGALTEILPVCEGIGELRLLIPALQRIACDQARPVVLIRPPYIPYAPAWARAGLPLHRLVWLQPSTDAEAQWAAEQILRAGIAGAVLLWSTTTADMALRRMQLSAEEGHALCFVFRGPRALRNASPAAVRLALHPATDALRIDVVKARGGHGGSVLCPLRCAA
ncbi:MAG: imuA [Nevskia sp.]|nr:imuA [Nevskia sp.]